MYSKDLYKLDSKGKVRILRVYTENADLIQESGLIDGEKVVHRKTCKGKNIGKANETTPENQAVLQAKSKVAEKLTEGYFETIEQAQNLKVVLPMLADDYKEKHGKIDWSKSVFVQPKLDGQRCLAIVENGEVKLLSRAGKEINTVEHIKQAILKIISPTSKLILDGELYAHGLSFQDNMKLIKKVRPGETEKIVYNVYDVVSSSPFESRIAFAKAVVDKCQSPSIQLVRTEKIVNGLDVHKFNEQFLSEGFEGTMIRHSETGYEGNKRSQYLLKFKDFKDISLPIIDIVPNDANPNHGTPVFELNGQTFKAGMKFSHSEREEWLLNKQDYIGSVAELRYFELTDDGLPRFPVCVGIRNDIEV